jgi:hypothetical protein
MFKIASTSTPTRRLRSVPVVAAALASLLVAASGASAQDFRSPDARDTGVVVTQPAPLDLRSPDARDAAQTLAQPAVQDLRSPDARNGHFVSTPQQQAQPSGGSSNWGYLAVGGLLSLMIAASVLLVQRRRGRVVPLGS